jgi:hypothetical protein
MQWYARSPQMPWGNVFKVTIFDYTMTNMVQRCLHHDPALAMMDE